MISSYYRHLLYVCAITLISVDIDKLCDNELQH